jgi:hypothetical protein
MEDASHTSVLRSYVKNVLGNLEGDSAIRLMIIIPLILMGGYLVLGVLEMWWIPPGSSTGDGINHLLFALLIRDRFNPWIPYSQFPELYSSGSVLGPFPNAYPSMSDAILSLLVATGLNPILSMKIFVSAVFCSGLVAYFLVFQNFTENRTLSLGGVLFLIISSGRELQTFHDGSFGELLAIMVLFPVSVYFITKLRWIESAICASGILYSHNLTSLGAFLPILTLYIQAMISKRDQRKSILESMLLLVLLSIPILVTSYAATLLNYSQGTAGTSGKLGLSLFPLDDPNTWLLALGCLGAVFVAFHFKEKALWIVSWLAGTFLLSMTNIFPGRFTRTLSFPSSIVLYLALTTVLAAFLEKSAFHGKRLFPVMRMRKGELLHSIIRGRSKKSGENLLTIAIAVSIFLLPICLGTFELSANMVAPTNLDYWDAKKVSVYYDLRSMLSPNDAVVVVDDDWAKYVLYPFTVLSIVPYSTSSLLNYHDRTINEAILLSLYGFPLDNSINSNVSTGATLEVRYIILSSPMIDRWYPTEELTLVRSLADRLDTSIHVTKIIDANSSDGWIRVYELVNPLTISNSYQYKDSGSYFAVRISLLVLCVLALIVTFLSQSRSFRKEIRIEKISPLFLLLVIMWFWFTFVLQ